MNGLDKEISIPNQVSIRGDTVTSLGNSWIICRSKTYAGRVYYFNTLTGEAVWNLNETEKVIAKKKTLESQNEIRNTEFPEPLESPNDEYVKNMAPARIYNKQVINNQYTRLPYPIPNVNFEQSSAVNAIGLGIPYAPFLKLSSNPIIFTQPIKYDIDSSKCNQTCITSIPLSMRFQNLQHISKFPKQRFLKRSVRRINYDNHNLVSGHTDLRNKLSNLRTVKDNQDNTSQKSDINNSHNSPCDSKIQWANQNLSSEDYSSTDDSMEDYDFNITPLKALFEINAQTNLWFLVVDEGVLFTNLNFISKLLRLDDKCHLMFPKVVISEVQKATTSIERIKSRRSLQAAVFISKMLSENRAIIDKENYNTDEYCKNITDCCLNLIRRDYKVVLITKKDNFKQCNINGCPIFTISDLKYFFINGKIKDMPLQKDTVPCLHNDEKSTITITIHNNSMQEGNRGDTSINCESQILPNNKDICVQTENVSHLVDAGVQTESFETNQTPKSDQMLVSKEAEDMDKTWTVTDRIYSKLHWRNIHLRDRSGVIKNKAVASESINLPANYQNSGSDQEYLMSIQKGDNDAVRHNNDDSNVMFEVSSKAMEEYLQMKSDEWVSRFIQIMEEALTQILQLDPPFVSDMPPPWTIYEASECIKRKFCHEPDVVDAANKLGDILFEIGGLRGKVNKYVTPKCYMKLYSFGVYLIDALQGPMGNNEDLHIAEKSLAKLLSDIQEPHLDSSNYDSFIDVDASYLNESNAVNDEDINRTTQESEPFSDSHPIVNITTPHKRLSVHRVSRAPSASSDSGQGRARSIKNPCEQTPTTSRRTSGFDRDLDKTSKSQSEILVSPPPNEITPTKYFLRYRKNKKIEPEPNVVRHLSPKQNFLKNFHLLNVDKDNAIVETPVNQTPNSDEHNEDSGNEENEKTTNYHKNNSNLFPNELTSGPKIIRNFTRCQEFEERLQRKCDLYTEEFSDEEYDGEYLEGSDMHYYEDMEPSESGLDSDLFANDTSVKKVKACKSFINKIAAHIKQIIQLIFSFCQDSRKRLLSKCDESEKLDIQMKAKNVAIFMEDFCLHLKRINKRENCESQLGVRYFLMKLGLERNEINEEELNHYRSFINECIIHGANLQNTLKILIDATQEA